MTENIKRDIYRYLKKKGKSSLAQIVNGIPGSNAADVLAELESEVTRGYIRKDTSIEPSRYSVKIKLGRLVSKDEIVPLWKHKDIVQRAGVQKINVISQSQLRAMLEALFWWQGSRGTCVGFAGALYKWLLYMLDNGDIPTIDEIKAAGKIIEQNIGCTAGIFRYVVMARTFFSPQWLYDRSRVFGGATFPAGSDTTWAAKTIASEGAVPWNECLTSITALCAPRLWPMVNSDYDQTLARLAPLAAPHTNKFAASNSFAEVYAAIQAGKAVFGPVNLPPDYFAPSDGEWKPYGADSAGGHAVFACLTDDTYHLIGTRGSWDGDEGSLKWYWFGERFFEENAGPFLIGLTADEAKIGSELYKSLNISANVPAQISVNGVNIGTSPQKIQMEIGKDYEVTASADKYDTQTQKFTASIQTQDLSFELTKTQIPKKNPLVLFLEQLINWILRRK